MDYDLDGILVQVACTSALFGFDLHLSLVIKYRRNFIPHLGETSITSHAVQFDTA